MTGHLFGSIPPHPKSEALPLCFDHWSEILQAVGRAALVASLVRSLLKAPNDALVQPVVLLSRLITLDPHQFIPQFQEGGGLSEAVVSRYSLQVPLHALKNLYIPKEAHPTKWASLIEGVSFRMRSEAYIAFLFLFHTSTSMEVIDIGKGG